MSAVPRPEQHLTAAILDGPRSIRVARSALREPEPMEVRVRLEGSGVCASNLPVWEGRSWFQYPLEPGAPGHEGWGRVDACGSEVRDLSVGDRVALISGHAYADYDFAPRDAVVPIPAALGDAPFPGEPLACAMNIFERSDIAAGQQVAIVGAGFLGLALTQLATRRGAIVTAFSRREFALERARGMGAQATHSSVDLPEAAKRARERTDNRGFDRVIEAVGVQATLDLATALTAEGGRLVIAGYHQDGLRQVDMQIWNWRGLDVVNAHERSVARYVGGMQAAIRAVLTGLLDPFPLFTHLLPLERLNDALALTSRRPDGFIKALVLTSGHYL